MNDQITPDARTEADAIASLSAMAEKLEILEPGELYGYLDKNRNHEIFDTDVWCKKPRRVNRTATCHTPGSLVQYITHALDCDVARAGEVEVWANSQSRRIVAILDGVDGHRDHRAVMNLDATAEWRQWAAVDGELMPQAKFAEFLEDHISQIAKPSGATLMEIAQSMQAHNSVEFESAQILANGQRSFKYRETVNATAGALGNLEIPAVFTLALRPFVGSDAFAVDARLRYRITQSQLLIGFKLVEPELRIEAACNDIVTDLTNSLPEGVMVYQGAA